MPLKPKGPKQNKFCYSLSRISFLKKLSFNQSYIFKKLTKVYILNQEGGEIPENFFGVNKYC